MAGACGGGDVGGERAITCVGQREELRLCQCKGEGIPRRLVLRLKLETGQGSLTGSTARSVVRVRRNAAPAATSNDHPISRSTAPAQNAPWVVSDDMSAAARGARRGGREIDDG